MIAVLFLSGVVTTCAVTQVEHVRHKRAATARTTFPMNSPGGKKSLPISLDSASCRWFHVQRRYVKAAKYPNCGVLASILAQVFFEGSHAFRCFFRAPKALCGSPLQIDCIGSGLVCGGLRPHP